jgi:hypothetical protein
MEAERDAAVSDDANDALLVSTMATPPLLMPAVFTGPLSRAVTPPSTESEPPPRPNVGSESPSPTLKEELRDARSPAVMSVASESTDSVREDLERKPLRPRDSRRRDTFMSGAPSVADRFRDGATAGCMPAPERWNQGNQPQRASLTRSPYHHTP